GAQRRIHRRHRALVHESLHPREGRARRGTRRARSAALREGSAGAPVHGPRRPAAASRARTPPRVRYDYDLIIVGAGMVGAALACLLGKERMRVALLDRAPPPSV